MKDDIQNEMKLGPRGRSACELWTLSQDSNESEMIQ